MCKCSWQDWSSLCFTDVDLWRTKLRILDGVVYNFFSTSPPPSVTKRVKKGTRKKVMREVMLVGLDASMSGQIKEPERVRSSKSSFSR